MEVKTMVLCGSGLHAPGFVQRFITSHCSMWVPMTNRTQRVTGLHGHTAVNRSTAHGWQCGGVEIFHYNGLLGL